MVVRLTVIRQFKNKLTFRNRNIESGFWLGFVIFLSRITSRASSAIKLTFNAG